MKTKKQKNESLTKLQDNLKRSKIVVFTSFAKQGEKGLTVLGLRELRNTLRPLKSKYSVEKKTLLQKAIKDSKQKGPDIFSFGGSMGVAFGFEDPFATAKVLHQFAKKNPVVKLYGAIFGDKVLTEAQINELAKLPSKEILLGRLVGMLSYPIRGLAVTLDQIAKKKSA